MQSCCFLLTVEQDMSSVVKGKVKGGLEESDPRLWVGGKRAQWLPWPTLANSFLFPKLS